MKQEWQERLLEAEPDELRGLGDTQLAQRIRQDAGLRAAAASILEQQDAMHHALTAFARNHATKAERAHAPAAGAEARGAVGPSQVHALQARRARSRRARSLAAVSLAAAAMLTLLLTRPTARVTPTPAPRPTPLTAQLDAASDRPFAVIATDNPDIAIVWLFNKED